MTTLRGLDSAYAPSKAQIAAAKAAGYDAWFGYFAGPNILNGWTDQQFLDVAAGGLQTGAYCSGWADPKVMKARADNLRGSIPGFVGMLDDESGIRSLKATAGVQLAVSENRRTARYMMHGGYARPVLEFVNGTWTVSAWVQPWLDASGFGQYGNLPVFAGVHASRYVFAAYPGGDPGLSWPSYYARPSDGNPCGWQFQGTTSMFGISVDLSHFDQNFFGTYGPGPGQITEDDMLYVGPFHPLAVTLKTFSAMTVYSDPSPNALPVSTVGANAAYAVKGFLYSSHGVQSTDLGGGAGPGIDLVWWQDNAGNWAPDADLITVGVAGAPVGAVLKTMPVGAKLYFAKESELAGLSGGGVTMPQVSQAISDAIAKIPAGVTMQQVSDAVSAALKALPDYATKADVAAAIIEALQGLPKTLSAHHHSVLNLVNTGPIIPD